MMVEVPVPVTIEVPVTVPYPTPALRDCARHRHRESRGSALRCSITLSPSSGPPGTRVQMQVVRHAAIRAGSGVLSTVCTCAITRDAAWASADRPTSACSRYPDISHDAKPGPYLVGVGDGQELDHRSLDDDAVKE